MVIGILYWHYMHNSAAFFMRRKADAAVKQENIGQIIEKCIIILDFLFVDYLCKNYLVIDAGYYG